MHTINARFTEHVKLTNAQQATKTDAYLYI
jgi:hypothetical protein